MKTLCLLPVATDARISRRLTALERRGVPLQVLAFERAGYPGKPMALGFQSLGHIDHGKYFGRLGALMAAVPLVRAAMADADVVYSFGLDLHALAWSVARTLRRRPALVYEVADIHPTLVGAGPLARCLRAVERRLLRDTPLTVVTSQAFITGFYAGVQKIAHVPHLLIENKPNLGPVAAVPARDVDAGPITIGYFGMLRCERSWQALEEITARGNGRIRVYFRGVPLGLSDFTRRVAENPWMEYGGPYNAPEDLPGMYSRIDLSWNAHRVDDNNSLLWNRTNRFYEACAFRTPLVAQVGSQDGDVVADRGIGVCVDLADIDAVARRILAIDGDQFARWQRRVAGLPASVYTETTEHEELAHHIFRLANAV